MTYKSSTAYGWSIYAGIIFIELLIDYSLRITSDNFRYNGIPETTWFLIQVVAAMIGGYFIIFGIKYLKSTLNKFIHLSANLILGLVFYILVIYSYVLGLEIDSF